MFRFLEAYSSNNISIWGISTQNEPADGDIPDFSFNCMGWTPETQKTFVVDNLGPTLEANGFEDLKLMILDDQRIWLPEWVNVVSKDLNV